MTQLQLSLQRRARQFPCSCGALPGEYCRTWDGRKAYHVHIDRVAREHDAWMLEHSKNDPLNKNVTRDSKRT